MPNLSKPPVTVLGLGAMGSALVEALLVAGYPTTVWNRTPDRAKPLVTKGAVHATNVSEAVAASRLVIVCLLDYKSVTDVLDTAGDALAGRVLVNLTNGTPAQARQVADRYDVDYLDGGIMAVPPMIGGPGAFLFYSGSRSAFDTNRPVLDVFGESQYVGTDSGLAALHDIGLLSGMYGMFVGVLHAFAFVGTEGVPATTFAPLLKRYIGGMLGFVDGAAEQIDKDDYTINVVSNIAMQSAGYVNLTQSTHDQGISPELLAPLGPLMARRVADGHGHEDLAGVIELLKKGKK
ncbi:3-hydroxyisobutyrate dehydrogenase-like beta-hydroxyacid dehydrogenase [Kibdelosporangium banguiense]|uniref:3-hydroxyisobutyrate dehydrogenase-like beta-hydroxyacid dehydrogenase n=1 Tax=Kibdelosporangium banguiense TaxID=1365924 RepID=A0ABS4T9E6_9PSEU|nr:NAD(P)-binding domain-containing protein [Kibdelosporangium banguiense]MBP2321045.1 3-hydroxyisobutyrate dehydrogenase-like beta-hydroxyacid dehydrogenase [Kibdelosporangium banguiense]